MAYALLINRIAYDRWHTSQSKSVTRIYWEEGVAQGRFTHAQSRHGTGVMPTCGIRRLAWEALPAGHAAQVALHWLRAGHRFLHEHLRYSTDILRLCPHRELPVRARTGLKD